MADSNLWNIIASHFWSVGKWALTHREVNQARNLIYRQNITTRHDCLEKQCYELKEENYTNKNIRNKYLNLAAFVFHI